MNQASPLGVLRRTAVSKETDIAKTNEGMIVSKQKRKKPPAAEFQIGDKIRVRHSVKDNDYPDMPLGGWASLPNSAVRLSYLHDQFKHGRPAAGN
jgi:hypothetical protein